MHTLVNLLSVIGGLFVVVSGSYVLYWNLSVQRVVISRQLKVRVAWIATLVFFLIVFLGVWGAAVGTHLLRPLQAGSLAPHVWYLLRNVTVALAYVAGHQTLKVARMYDFVRGRRAIPERLVWALSPAVWPWLVANFIVSLLNVILVDHPLLGILTIEVLHFATLFIFFPVIVAGMISARRWVADYPLRESMKWNSLLIISFVLSMWASSLVFSILLQVPELRTSAAQLLRDTPGLLAILGSIFFPAVIYTAYKSSKSLVMTHKLTLVEQAAQR